MSLVGSSCVDRWEATASASASAAIAAVVAAARPSRATMRAAACISFSRVAAPGVVTVFIQPKAPAMPSPVKINELFRFIRRIPASVDSARRTVTVSP